MTWITAENSSWFSHLGNFLISNEIHLILLKAFYDLVIISWLRICCRAFYQTQVTVRCEAYDPKNRLEKTDSFFWLSKQNKQLRLNDQEYLLFSSLNFALLPSFEFSKDMLSFNALPRQSTFQTGTFASCLTTLALCQWEQILRKSNFTWIREANPTRIYRHAGLHYFLFIGTVHFVQKE